MSTETDDETEIDDADAMAEAKRILAGDRKWPYELTLGTPVQFGKETITELTFAEGTFGMIKGLKLDRAPDFDQLMTIASKMCGRPLRVIELLAPGDAGEVTAIALGFFARCRGAGRTISGS